MKKLLSAILLGGALTLTSTTVALANDFNANAFGCWQAGVAFCDTISRESHRSMMGTRGMMWDDNGNLLTREAFEERVDGWIDAGYITADHREFFLNMHDGHRNGGFGRCGGLGRGAGRGRGTMRAF